MEFASYQDGAEYVAKREAEIGVMKFRSTQEYKDLYPKLVDAYRREGFKKPKRRRVEVSICLHV